MPRYKWKKRTAVTSKLILDRDERVVFFAGHQILLTQINKKIWNVDCVRMRKKENESNRNAFPFPQEHKDFII